MELLNILFRELPTTQYAIAPAIIGAGIVAASSLVGGLLNKKSQSNANSSNIDMARENNAANQQLQKNQNDWNLKQWNRENEYNSATAQRARLEKAGLNPQLALNQIATGSSTSNNLTSANYTPMQAPTINPENGLAMGVQNAGNDFVNTYNNIRMANANVDKLQADTNKSNAEASAISGYKQQESQSNTSKNMQAAELAKAQTESFRIQNQIAQTWGNQQTIAQLENTVAQTLNLKQDRIKSEKQAELYVAQAIETFAKTHNIKLQSEQLEQTTELIVQHMKLDNYARELTNTSQEVTTKFDVEKGYGSKNQLYRQSIYDADIKQKERDNWWLMNIGRGIQGLGKISYSVSKRKQ